MSHSARAESQDVAGIVDPVWTRLRGEAEAAIRQEPAMTGFVVTTVLNHPTLESAVVHRLASRLGDWPCRRPRHRPRGRCPDTGSPMRSTSPLAQLRQDSLRSDRLKRVAVTFPDRSRAVNPRGAATPAASIFRC